MIRTVKKKIPHYKTITKKVRVKSAGSCTRLYCTKKGPRSSTFDSTIKMATTRDASGSPNLGLIPTMKALAP